MMNAHAVLGIVTLLLATGRSPGMVLPRSRAVQRGLPLSVSTTETVTKTEMDQPSKIKVGDRLPLDITVQVLEKTETGLTNKDVSLVEYFMGKKVVLFCVPGAFTPTGTNLHLKGFLELSDDFKKKGIDDILCVSVNDPFVLHAWSETTNATSRVTFLADGRGTLTHALGLEFDTGEFGGIRCCRLSMLVHDGVVKTLNVEDRGKFTELSGAAFILSQI